MFQPHKNLSDEINAAIVESEVAGGVYLDKLLVGKRLLVYTQDTIYTIERRTDGLYISGSIKYCPNPVKCRIPGSNFGGSMLKMNFIGRGLFMEYHIDSHPSVIVTSLVREVEEQ